MTKTNAVSDERSFAQKYTAYFFCWVVLSLFKRHHKWSWRTTFTNKI